MGHPPGEGVLEDAAEPMTAMEIAREIQRRFGEPVERPTVLYVLIRSRHARRKVFERIEPARYRLAAS